MLQRRPQFYRGNDMPLSYSTVSFVMPCSVARNHDLLFLTARKRCQFYTGVVSSPFRRNLVRLYLCIAQVHVAHRLHRPSRRFRYQSHQYRHIRSQRRDTARKGLRSRGTLCTRQNFPPKEFWMRQANEP